jgi:hypothetical protein
VRDPGRFQTRGNLLPHPYPIPNVNARFIARKKNLHQKTSRRQVNMAYLAVVSSSAVNGVAAIHSEIVKQDIFNVRGHNVMMACWEGLRFVGPRTSRIRGFPGLIDT